MYFHFLYTRSLHYLVGIKKKYQQNHIRKHVRNKTSENLLTYDTMIWYHVLQLTDLTNICKYKLVTKPLHNITMKDLELNKRYCCYLAVISLHIYLFQTLPTNISVSILLMLDTHDFLISFPWPVGVLFVTDNITFLIPIPIYNDLGESEILFLIYATCHGT